MADVSDERLAKILDKAEKQSAIDSVTIGRVSTLWIESEDLRQIVLELQARRAADAKAVEVDLPDYLRFGEPDMFPPAQK